MLESHFAGNSTIGVILQELVEQIGTGYSTQLFQRHKVGNGLFPPLREFTIVVRQSQDGWPRIRRGRSTTLKDLEQLISVVIVVVDSDDSNNRKARNKSLGKKENNIDTS
jgi:hypothetical protein